MAEHGILEHDLAVLRAMVEHIEPYLNSDVTRWDMGVPDMPPMTIGGILMRKERLQALDDQLAQAERDLRDEAIRRFEEALVEKVVRFEQRAHQELHARLREWTNYLRDLPSKSAARPEIYSNIADTRVVIQVLVDKLSESPYQLETRIPKDIAAVDRRLQSLFAPGPFIWDAVWAPAYPEDRFWYLYGYPKSE